MKEKKIAVTGSSGYIGSNIVSKFISDPQIESVLAFDRVPAKTLSGVTQNIVDIAEAPLEELEDRLKGADVLFHLAAARTDWGLTYEDYRKDNVEVTSKLIAAARNIGIKKWIYYGTVGVYGSSASPLDESSKFNPQSDYAKTKAEAELELLKVSEEESWSIRIVRPSAVFSENQPDNTNLYRLIEAIRRNKFVLIGDGSEVKTTSYLHNLVDATLWLYRDLSSGGIAAYNYVDEPRLTTREIVGVIRSELGCRIPLIRLPLSLVERPARILDWLGNRIHYDFPITAARIRKFCTATSFDGSKIRKAGFAPSYSSEAAIRRTVRWHMEQFETKTSKS